MKTWKGVCGAIVAIIALSLIYVRLPRLNPDLLEVTSQVHGGVMTIEYRSSEPFLLVLYHSQSVSPEVAQVDRTGPRLILGGRQTERHEIVGELRSRHDWLRGQEVVRLSLTRGESLQIEGPSEGFAVTPWTVPSASNVQWKAGRWNQGLGTGIQIVEIGRSPEQGEEFLYVQGYPLNRTGRD